MWQNAIPMKKTTVYLTNDQKIKLEKRAKERGGQKVAEIIRAAIDKFLE